MEACIGFVVFFGLCFVVLSVLVAIVNASKAAKAAAEQLKEDKLMAKNDPEGFARLQLHRQQQSDQQRLARLERLRIEQQHKRAQELHEVQMQAARDARYGNLAKVGLVLGKILFKQ